MKSLFLALTLSLSVGNVYSWSMDTHNNNDNDNQNSNLNVVKNANANANTNNAAAASDSNSVSGAVASGGHAGAVSGSRSQQRQGQQQAQQQGQHVDASSANTNNLGADAANENEIDSSSNNSIDVDSTAVTTVDYDDYPVMPAPASFAGLCHGGAGVSERDISLSVAQVERYCQKLQMADAYYAAAATVDVSKPERPEVVVDTCGPNPELKKGGYTQMEFNLWKNCYRTYKVDRGRYETEYNAWRLAMGEWEQNVAEREAFMQKAYETIEEADGWIENMAPVHAVSEVSRGLVFPAIIIFAILAL